MKVFVMIRPLEIGGKYIQVTRHHPTVMGEGTELYECELDLPLIDEERAEYDKPARDFIRDVVIARASTVGGLKNGLDYTGLVENAYVAWQHVKKLTSP